MQAVLLRTHEPIMHVIEHEPSFAVPPQVPPDTSPFCQVTSGARHAAVAGKNVNRITSNTSRSPDVVRVRVDVVRDGRQNLRTPERLVLKRPSWDSRAFRRCRMLPCVVLRSATSAWKHSVLPSIFVHVPLLPTANVPVAPLVACSKLITHYDNGGTTSVFERDFGGCSTGQAGHDNR